MNVQHWNADRDGPFSEPALAAKLRALGYTVQRYVYPPGTYFPTHTHAADKIDAVTAGCFRLVVDGAQYELGPGDWIEVPRQVPHSAEVIGTQAVVSLDAVRG